MNQIVLIALRRPYTFVVLAILIVLFGAKSVLQTPTDVFPNIKIPVISVVWSYAGLLPSDVSGRITFFFERALTDGQALSTAKPPTTDSASPIYFFRTASTSPAQRPRSRQSRRRSSSSCRRIFRRP